MTRTAELPPSEDQPRHRLIRAGVEVFSRYGYEPATTRMLAAAAGVNLAAIPYYFGGKEGLYHAVIAHIAEHISRLVVPALDRIREELARETPGRERLQELLVNQLAAFCSIVGFGELRSWGAIIMREQMQPTAAFQLLFDQVIRHEQSLCVELLSRITGLPREAEELVFRAHALHGQVLIFVAARASMQTMAGVEDYAPRHVDLIRRVVAEHTRAAIQALAAMNTASTD